MEDPQGIFSYQERVETGTCKGRVHLVLVRVSDSIVIHYSCYYDCIPMHN